MVENQIGCKILTGYCRMSASGAGLGQKIASGAIPHPEKFVRIGRNFAHGDISGVAASKLRV